MIFEKLQELIAEQFSTQPDAITMETSFADDLNAHSLDIVELSMMVEEEFGIAEDDEEELVKLITVGDVVKFIADRID